MDSARYRTAKNSLHVNGKTSLSHHLNNALEQQGIKDENEKAQKIYDLIEKRVSKQEIKNWLSGEVVMPRNKSLLVPLSQLAPRLEPYKEALLTKVEPIEKINIGGTEFEVQYGASYPFYRLYTTIRQGIRRYIEAPKGKGNGTDHNESGVEVEPKVGISLGHEIDIVVSKYFREINPETVAVRVTNIKELERTEALKIPSEKHEKLKKGVLSITADKKQEFLQKNNLDEISINDVIDDAEAFAHILGLYGRKLVKNKRGIYFDNKRTRELDSSEAAYSVGSAFEGIIPPSAKPLFKEHTDIVAQLAQSGDDFVRYIQRLKKEHAEFMRYRKYLKELGAWLRSQLTVEEYNDIESLINAVGALSTSFPKDFLEYTSLGKEYEWQTYLLAADEMTISKSERDKLERRYTKLERELKGVYGYDSTPRNVSNEDAIAVLKKYGLSGLVPKIFEE